MKILKHGDVIRCECPKCGCIFLANMFECQVNHRFADNIPIKEIYHCDCPECDEEYIEGERVKSDG